MFSDVKMPVAAIAAGVSLWFLASATNSFQKLTVFTRFPNSFNGSSAAWSALEAVFSLAGSACACSSAYFHYSSNHDKGTALLAVAFAFYNLFVAVDNLQNGIFAVTIELQAIYILNVLALLVGVGFTIAGAFKGCATKSIAGIAIGFGTQLFPLAVDMIYAAQEVVFGNSVGYAFAGTFFLLGAGLSTVYGMMYLFTSNGGGGKALVEKGIGGTIADVKMPVAAIAAAVGFFLLAQATTQWSNSPTADSDLFSDVRGATFLVGSGFAMAGAYFHYSSDHDKGTAYIAFAFSEYVFAQCMTAFQPSGTKCTAESVATGGACAASVISGSALLVGYIFVFIAAKDYGATKSIEGITVGFGTLLFSLAVASFQAAADAVSPPVAYVFMGIFYTIGAGLTIAYGLMGYFEPPPLIVAEKAKGGPESAHLLA